MAKLPITTLRRDIDVRVVYGQSIFELYQQIQRLLIKETPELTHFFAEPIVNAVRGEISWNTRATGAVRPASDLSAEEWSKAATSLKKNCDLINQLISKLNKAGRSNSSGTEALQNMLMTPDLKSSLFLVGNELVLTQWGCYKFGTEARHADLFEQIDSQSKIKQINPPNEISAGKETQIEQSTLPQNNLSTVVPFSNPEPIIDKTPDDESEKKPEEKSEKIKEPILEPYLEEVIVRKNYLWRWLLLLILLLLLLFGFFWKYWQSNSNVLVDKETVLRSEIAELWTKIEKKARDCGLNPITTEESNLETGISDVEIANRRRENNIDTNSTASVSLAWNDKSDLDILVHQPDGRLVFFGPCQGNSCGTLDVDANRCIKISGCSSLTERPLENISWNGVMLPGKYIVSVHMYSANAMPSELKSVPFTVQLNKDGKSTKYTGEFQPRDIICSDLCRTKPRQVTEFTIDR